MIVPEMVDPFGAEGEAGLEADGEAGLGRDCDAGLGTGGDTTGDATVGWLLQPSATAVIRAPRSAHRRGWRLADLSIEPDASAVLASEGARTDRTLSLDRGRLNRFQMGGPHVSIDYSIGSGRSPARRS